MRYCPNLDSPHRQLTGSRADFLDHVEYCAKYGTLLDTELLPQPPHEESTDTAEIE